MAKEVNELQHITEQVIEHIDMTPTYRKVAKSGNARYLTVTHVVPINWHLVEITPMSFQGDTVVLKVRKVA